ncbi:MAG TPA: TIGR04438 family Trp-rich protein [Burkholderiaceae bacterium]|nr:TIGR04438 family Trp-rich protein [Burkholderiaceae bacterium]
MPLLWIGAVLVLLRWLEIGPFATLSWWWVLAPLGVAFAWFEGLEKLFGRDKRQVDAIEWERRRQERVSEQFRSLQQPGQARSAGRPPARR